MFNKNFFDWHFYHTQQTTQNLFLSISMKSIYKIKANKTMPKNFLLFQLPVRLIYLIKRFLTERKREQSLIVRKCISSSSKHILNQTFFLTFYQTKYQTVCHIFLFLLCESMWEKSKEKRKVKNRKIKSNRKLSSWHFFYKFIAFFDFIRDISIKRICLKEKEIIIKNIQWI